MSDSVATDEIKAAENGCSGWHWNNPSIVPTWISGEYNANGAMPIFAHD